MAADQVWLAEWRQCILAQAWSNLERHQNVVRGTNLAYLVLRLSVDHPKKDSSELAACASAQLSQRLSSAAFRKQLSRARRLFAELIAAAVRDSLHQPTREELQDELADLGLLESLRDFLPDGKG